jgi:gliding motility-associated-like protein
MVLKKIVHTLFLLCLTGSAFAQALTPPVLQCAEVMPNGNVRLSWSQVSDPASQFTAYEIWNAPTAGGTFSAAGTVNAAATTTFIHTTVTPLSSNECYYIVVLSSDGTSSYTSLPSNTVCTISLDVQPSISPPGQVQLNWTSAYPGLGPAGVGSYEVWQENPAGTWTLATTIPNGVESWSFEVTRCEVTYNFQIRQQTPFGCLHQSDVAGGTFYDITPPDIPEVTSVTIDHATDDAVVQWNPSNAPDTQGYILYRCSGTNVTLLDTIYGGSADTFTDLLAQTTTGRVCYLLASIDTCYSGTPPSPNTSPTSDICNCSVFLSPVAYGLCNDFVNLSWTPYTGWQGGVAEYRIYHTAPGSATVLAYTLAGTEDTFSFPLGLVEPGAHAFYIEAVSADGYTARSNRREVQISYPVTPDYNYLSSASVTGKTEVTVTVQTQATGTDHVFHLDRRKFDDAEWTEIMNATNLGGSEVSFSDTDPDVSSFTYTYRVRVRNLCNDWVDTTNIGRTVLLRGMANNDRLVNALQWSHYGGWENGVLSYRIWRSEAGVPGEQMIEEVNGTQTYYEDDVADLLYSPGRFCYVIEAVERPSSLFPGTSFTARSNELCLAQEPVIWVPSAFVVDGFNTTFRPIISFADFSQYQMLIYSRWGDVIYETDDINQPWDGRMNGKLVQEGVYAYYISVRDGNGRPHEARGTVVMLSNRDQ